jgi:hypothetical protein
MRFQLLGHACYVLADVWCCSCGGCCALGAVLCSVLSAETLFCHVCCAVCCAPAFSLSHCPLQQLLHLCAAAACFADVYYENKNSVRTRDSLYWLQLVCRRLIFSPIFQHRRGGFGSEMANPGVTIPSLACLGSRLGETHR